MKRILIVSPFILGCWLAGAAVATAQVYVRAPFVRVQTGPGVAVQAPFVDIFVPPAGPLIAPGPVYVVPPPSVYIPPTPAAPRVEVVPATVVPVSSAQVLTLDQFAASFKPRGGSFDVDVINPVTRQPTKVRFTLPEETPKRVIVNAREIEFRYGLLRFVRIEFDGSGAQVNTRLGR